MNEYFPTVVQAVPFDNFYVQVFFDDGKIVESGTHDELYNKNGKYRAMYEAQYSNQKEKVA